MVKDTDKGYKKFVEQMNKAAKSSPPYVKVGVLEKEGEKKYEDALTTVQVATYHEFGTDNEDGGVRAPERSFLRSTYDEQQKKAEDLANQIIFDVFVKRKYDLKKGLGLLGEWFRSEVVRKIRSGIAPALSASTVAQKGSSTPLIDTGQLVQSINYKVEGVK